MKHARFFILVSFQFVTMSRWGFRDKRQGSGDTMLWVESIIQVNMESIKLQLPVATRGWHAGSSDASASRRPLSSGAHKVLVKYEVEPTTRSIELLEKFPAFYGTPSFIVVVTRVRYWTSSWGTHTWCILIFQISSSHGGEYEVQICLRPDDGLLLLYVVTYFRTDTNLLSMSITWGYV
jgi:hypothetical protein